MGHVRARPAHRIDPRQQSRIVRATSIIAYQSRDLADAMRQAGQTIDVLKVDGGGTANPFLMQFQSDILGVPVEVAAVQETTALGAARNGPGQRRLARHVELAQHWRASAPRAAHERRSARGAVRTLAARGGAGALVGDVTLHSTHSMFQKTVLPNGLRVVQRLLPHTRSVSISIFIGAGSRYESDDVAGVSHFLEHMLFKGTRRRPSAREISGIEGIGGVMNAGTDKELTVYWAKVGDHRFAHTLDILADSLLNSLMDPAELEKERAVILEELAMTEDRPG